MVDYPGTMLEMSHSVDVMADWMTFLDDVAIECGLSPEQRRAFLARFDRANASRTDKWIVENTKDDGQQVFAGEAAFTKLMTGVYGAVQRAMFPDLAKVAKGKRGKLETFLKEEFERRQAPQPPILGDQELVQSQTGLKPSAPRPRVRLPENFVARPEALDAVKRKLLRESGQTLVVSAIAGLGGLGKSVLATALVLDPEVQARFADGILWVTLGQNPDLLGLIGEWIRELDKSRESFSATTLESASGYLHNLLAEKRVLLVVDDVWHADHADWFRVGGTGCRVLVTTREAVIEGADYYPLDLMTEDEAIALVQEGKLKKKWDENQAEAVRRFARVVGYLPLALDLSVNLVRDGMSWGELQHEFEDERKAVALELLDASEAFEHLPEERQRRYSLKACFNLSLKRLNSEQLRRFAWLGVLPEDVRVDARMVGTLWGVSEVMAKRGLIELFRRSFLTSAGESIEGYALYRVHDLMHDTARGLIEAGVLDGVKDLAAAHGAFVDRYGAIDYGKKLCGLPKDGYIHRHLTWHWVMARREDGVHELLGASDTQGRNAWFEACEEIGEPLCFLKSVADAWKLAENTINTDFKTSILLQCRYSLITSSLISRHNNIPANSIRRFVQNGYWTFEQAWSYLLSIQEQAQIASAIESICPVMPEKYAKQALEIVLGLREGSHKKAAIQQLGKYFQLGIETETDDEKIHEKEALDFLCNYYNLKRESTSIRDLINAVLNDTESDKFEFLEDLVPDIELNDLAFFIESIQNSESPPDQVRLLCSLAKRFPSMKAIAIQVFESLEGKTDDLICDVAAIEDFYIEDAFYYLVEEEHFSEMRYGLSNIVHKLSEYHFNQLLDYVKEVFDPHYQDEIISIIAPFLSKSLLTKAVNIAFQIEAVDFRSSILESLSSYIHEEDLDWLFNTICAIQTNFEEVWSLIEIARIRPETYWRISQKKIDSLNDFKKILIHQKLSSQSLLEASEDKPNFIFSYDCKFYEYMSKIISYEISESEQIDFMMKILEKFNVVERVILLIVFIMNYCQDHILVFDIFSSKDQKYFSVLRNIFHGADNEKIILLSRRIRKTLSIVQSKPEKFSFKPYPNIHTACLETKNLLDKGIIDLNQKIIQLDDFLVNFSEIASKAANSPYSIRNSFFYSHLNIEMLRLLGTVNLSMLFLVMDCNSQNPYFDYCKQNLKYDSQNLFGKDLEKLKISEHEMNNKSGYACFMAHAFKEIGNHEDLRVILRESTNLGRREMLPIIAILTPGINRILGRDISLEIADMLTQICAQWP